MRPLPDVAASASVGGLIVGMTSVGSGSLIIVLLLLLYPTLAAGQLVGTDLVQAVPLVGAAALGHLFFGDVSFAIAGSLLVGAIPGVLIGARISSRAPDHIIRPILVVVLIASAAKLLDAPNEWLLAFLGTAVFVGVVLSLRAVVQGRRRGVGARRRAHRHLTRPRTTALGADGQSAGVTIHYELDDEHIVLITIDRPEARNSADMDHFKWLREAWERFDADADAWVAIITGVEDTFFTGADLKTYVPEITKYSASGSGRRASPRSTATASTTAPRRCCAGRRSGSRSSRRSTGSAPPAGMEMLGGVDIRVACPEAQFAVMEPKRGLFAGGGTTVRLPRQIPFPLAMEFLLCADLIPADRAYEMGLLNGSCRVTSCSTSAYDYARRITANAPLAVQATKQSVWEGLGMNLQGRVPQRGAALVGDLRRPRTPRKARRPSRRSARRAGRASRRGACVDPRTPCIVGVGSRTWHPDDTGDAGAPEPLEMWEEVARAAAEADSGADACSTGSTRSTSSTARPGSTTTPSAGCANGSASTPTRRHYSGIGGTTPQLLRAGAGRADPAR